MWPLSGVEADGVEVLPGQPGLKRILQEEDGGEESSSHADQTGHMHTPTPQSPQIRGGEITCASQMD